YDKNEVEFANKSEINTEKIKNKKVIVLDYN
ncbi:MAG: hypothetical protein AWL62_2520, partial [Halanaerobium sp. T82-1]